MTTRETAKAPPIFNREIKYWSQICTIVCTIILHPYLGFLLVQARNNENQELTQFFPEFIALLRNIYLTENNRKSPWHPLFYQK